MHSFDPLCGLSATGMVRSGRPRSEEVAEYGRADVEFVQGDDATEALVAQARVMLSLFTRINEADIAGLRSAGAAWTVKEVVGHLCDDERIFLYRGLCIARQDARELASFDQDDYQRAAHHEERPWRALIREYAAVRAASVHFFASLSRDEWQREGTIAGYRATLRGVAFHIAGHELRHARQLHSRYLHRLLG